MDELAATYKFRLSGIVHNEKQTLAKIDVMDSTFHLKESFSIEDLVGMGWEVRIETYGIVINKVGKGRKVSHIVRSWSIDPFGRVSRETRKDGRLRQERS
ncbi:MAG: hypothetical protein MI754_04485 [Chromatiales bacterium]|nr:hypothetical protein [Chromatiales bacterium]